jgi:hypothetical protein
MNDVTRNIEYLKEDDMILLLVIIARSRDKRHVSVM